MPFVRTAVPRDTSPDRKAAIVQGIHQALIDAIAMPPEELFNLVTAYGPDEFFFSRHFNGIAHSDTLIVVEITLRRGRSDAMKRDLFARIADNLARTAGVAPRDVFIFLHENDYSDWSVGNGVPAMLLQQNRGTD